MKKKEAWYAVIGGCVGAVLTLVVCSFSPLGAQSQSDGNFDTIRCRRLIVFKPGSVPGLEYQERVLEEVDERLGARVSVLNLLGNHPRAVSMGIDEHGGKVSVLGKNGDVDFFTDEHGGRVNVRGKNRLGGAAIGVDEHGGSVDVVGKDEKSIAIMHINEELGGSVEVYGGMVTVYGGDGKSSASMVISEKYGGMVGVTDNNGVSTVLNPD